MTTGSSRSWKTPYIALVKRLSPAVSSHDVYAKLRLTSYARLLCQHDCLDEVYSGVDAWCQMEAHSKCLANGGRRNGERSVQLGQGSNCKPT